MDFRLCPYLRERLKNAECVKQLYLSHTQRDRLLRDDNEITKRLARLCVCDDNICLPRSPPSRGDDVTFTDIFSRECTLWVNWDRVRW